MLNAFSEHRHAQQAFAVILSKKPTPGLSFRPGLCSFPPQFLSTFMQK